MNKQDIQNFLINRSFLVNQADCISDVLDFYKCLQVDPIKIIARSHEFSLWNRVKNFKIQNLYNELYKDKKYFEYWLQLFSIIPIKHYPYFKARLNTKKGWQTDFYQAHSKEITQTLEYITQNGVTSSKELSHIAKIKKVFSWNNDSSRTALLEYLWDTGKIMICERRGNFKYYNLTERVINKKLLEKTLSEKESLAFLLESHFDYLGILRRPFLNSGRVGYVKRLGLVELFDEWLASGKIIKVTIDGVKTNYFCLKKHLATIETLAKQETNQELNILPPLDPFIIDRKLIEDIFGFKYTWEAYTPMAKRKFGYYGMPILYKNNFVGQIELRRNKQNEIDVVRLESRDKSRSFQKALKEKFKDLENIF